MEEIYWALGFALVGAVLALVKDWKKKSEDEYFKKNFLSLLGFGLILFGGIKSCSVSQRTFMEKKASDSLAIRRQDTIIRQGNEMKDTLSKYEPSIKNDAQNLIKLEEERKYPIAPMGLKIRYYFSVSLQWFIDHFPNLYETDTAWSGCTFFSDEENLDTTELNRFLADKIVLYLIKDSSFDKRWSGNPNNELMLSAGRVDKWTCGVFKPQNSEVKVYIEKYYHDVELVGLSTSSLNNVRDLRGWYLECYLDPCSDDLVTKCSITLLTGNPLRQRVELKNLPSIGKGNHFIERLSIVDFRIN
jgi:hypothetical protein